MVTVRWRLGAHQTTAFCFQMFPSIFSPVACPESYMSQAEIPNMKLRVNYPSFFQAVCLSIYVIVERTCLKYNDYERMRVDTKETTHLLHSSDSRNHSLDQSDSLQETQDDV